MWIMPFHLFIFLTPFLLAIGRKYTIGRKLYPGEFNYYLLLYFLIFCVGLQGIVTGVMQIFDSETHAYFANRPWSPFVWEVGMMNLAFGMLGFMCIWLRGSFWAAAGIGYSIFLILSFFGHLYEAIFHGNYTRGNLGLHVWIDLCTAILIFFMIFKGKYDKQ